MLTVPVFEMPLSVQKYIGNIKESLVLEKDGKPFIKIEPALTVSHSEKYKAYENLQQFKGRLPADFDFKAELERIRDKRHDIIS